METASNVSIVILARMTPASSTKPLHRSACSSERPHSSTRPLPRSARAPRGTKRAPPCDSTSKRLPSACAPQSRTVTLASTHATPRSPSWPPWSSLGRRTATQTRPRSPAALDRPFGYSTTVHPSTAAFAGTQSPTLNSRKRLRNSTSAMVRMRPPRSRPGIASAAPWSG